MGLQEDQSKRVGRYRLKRLLAKGGMAEVYLASAEGAHGFKKDVAVKRILPEFAAERQFINMMVDEAKIMVLLGHPNIAQVFEFGQQENELFLVMEYVRGEQLNRVASRVQDAGEPLDHLAAAYVMMEVLRGLHAAHEQKDSQGRPAQIIHRDVSPQNILVTYDGHVKVIDFGVAKAMNRLEKTKQGTVKGKLRYLAPEMLDAEEYTDSRTVDCRADIFACGSVLFELLSGEKLFSGKSAVDIYRAILEAPIDVQLESIDPALAEILRKALERHVRDRYASAADFADELQTYIYRNDPSFSARHIASIMSEHFSIERDEKAKLDQDFDTGIQRLWPDDLEIEKTQIHVAGESTRGDKASNLKSAGLSSRALSQSDAQISANLGLLNPEEITALYRDDIPTQTSSGSPSRLKELVTQETNAVVAPGPVDNIKERRRRLSLLWLIFIPLFLVGSIALSWNFLNRATRDSNNAQLALSTFPTACEAKILGVDTVFRSTPFEVDLPPGDYEVRARCENHQSENVTLSLKPRAQLRKGITLKKNRVPLDLGPLPSGTQLFWRAKEFAAGEGLPAGESGVLEVKAPGFAEWSERIDVGEQSSIRVDVSLLKEKIEPTPESRKVNTNLKKRTIRKSRLGKNTAATKASPGTKSVAVDNAKTEVIIEKPQPEVQPEPPSKNRSKAKVATGKIFLKSKPYLAEVWVDGKKAPNTTPIQLKVDAGTRRITLKVPGTDKKKSFKIKVPKNGKVEKTIVFD